MATEPQTRNDCSGTVGKLSLMPDSSHADGTVTQHPLETSITEGPLLIRARFCVVGRYIMTLYLD